MSKHSRSRSATRTYHDRSDYDRRKKEDSRDEHDGPLRRGNDHDRRRRYDQDRRENNREDYDRRDKKSYYSERGEGSSRAHERRDDRNRDRNRARPRSRSPRSRPGLSSGRSASPRSRPRSESKSKSVAPEDEDVEDKAKPNFNPSGLLAAETKQVKHADGTSTVLKYHEPPEARKPIVGWRLYVFKGKEQVGKWKIDPLFGIYGRRLGLTSFLVDLLHISRQSAYLVGRDRMVVDIPLDHPSCSKQHAAIQCMRHFFMLIRQG